MSVGEEAFVVHRHRPRISLCSLWYKLLVPHKEEKSFFLFAKEFKVFIVAKSS